MCVFPQPWRHIVPPSRVARSHYTDAFNSTFIELKSRKHSPQIAAKWRNDAAVAFISSRVCANGITGVRAGMFIISPVPLMQAMSDPMRSLQYRNLYYLRRGKRHIYLQGAHQNRAMPCNCACHRSDAIGVIANIGAGMNGFGVLLCSTAIDRLPQEWIHGRQQSYQPNLPFLADKTPCHWLVWRCPLQVGCAWR